MSDDIKDRDGPSTTTVLASNDLAVVPLFQMSKMYKLLPWGYSSKRMIRSLGPRTLHRLALWIGGLTIWVSAYHLGCYGSISGFSEVKHMLKLDDSNISSKATAAKEGGIVSMNTLGMLLGALCGGTVNEGWGRTKTISTAFLIGTIGMAIQTGSTNVWMFSVSRIITGFGIGMSDSTVPTWIAEISPTEHRGGSVATELSFAGFAVMTTYWLGYGMRDYANQSLAWRVNEMVPIIPYLFCFLCFFFLPESPRWLASVGKVDEAKEVLQLLREADSDEELKQVVASCEMQRQSGEKHTFWTMLTRKDQENTRRRAWLTLLIQFMATFFFAYGIVLSYGTTVFGYAGFSSNKISIITGINDVQYPWWFLVGVFFSDKVGRRPLLMTGSFGAGAMLIIIGILAKVIIDRSGEGQDVFSLGCGITTCVFIYAAFQASSFGGLAWVYPVEIFPQASRSKGGALSIVGFAAGQFLANFIAPYMFTTITYNSFFVFGILTLISGPVIYCFYPETKGRTLEDIYWLFSGPRFTWQAEAHYRRAMEEKRNLAA